MIKHNSTLRLGLLFLMFCLVLTMFIGAVSALEFDNVKETSWKVGDFALGEKVLAENELWQEYKPVELVNTFGFGKRLWAGGLTEHTKVCEGDYCYSIMEVYTSGDDAVISDLIFKTQQTDGSWIEQDVRRYNLFYWGAIQDYEYQCTPSGKLSANGTEELSCSNVKVGVHQGWIKFNVGDVLEAGDYKIKLEAWKKPSRTVDWVIKTNGKWIDEWAVWGAVIGVGGVQASITINSPANNSISLTNSVTVNATANVTGGAYLVNASLNLSVNGGAWEVRNTTTIGGGTTSGLVAYYNLDEESGIYGNDSIGNKTLTHYNSPTLNAVGKINKSVDYDGSNDYSRTSETFYLGTGNLTMGGWFYADTTEDTNVLFGLDYNAVNSIQLTNTGGYYAVNTYKAGNYVQTVSTTNVTTGSWVHVLLMRYGTTFEIFINGTSVHNGTNANFDMSLNDVPLDLGYSISRNIGATGYFDGKIDEFGVWNKTLTGTEVTLLYNSGAGSRPATGGTSSTVTFTNTFNAGDVVDWNMKFCDSDGDCGQAVSNYRFTIDSTAPTITLAYPTSLIDYGKLNGSLQLNLTATDASLDKVWYNYNGTNVTIVGATSGVYNLSNITLSTKKNVTIYANDTVGNLNETLFSWDYKVFENSRSFTTPIVETSLDTFIINVTSSLSLSSVYLNYNGTEYSTSLSGGVYSRQLTIPAVTQDSTMQVSWRFVYDGTNITSDITNQTISKLTFNICNATINNTLVNFTTSSATNPFPIVNSTFKSSWMLSASTGATPTNFTYEDIAGNKSSYAFCTNTNTTTIYTDAELEYDGTGYALNFYYLEDINLTATNPRNISLYLLNDTLSTVTILKVVSASQQPQPDHQINIQSYDVGTGTFYLVGMAKTNFNGEDVVYLNWYDTLYKFIVLDETGEVVKTTGTTKISSTPTIIELENEITFPYDKFEDFVYSLYYDNATSNFVLTYTKPSGEVDKACLRVYKHSTGNDSLICDECETSVSATLFCNVASYGNGTYVGLFYATGSFSLVDWIYEYVGGTFQTTIYNLLGNEDASFYAFLFAGLITVALFINAVFGIIALMIGLIGASALGFTALQWGQMTGVIIIGGFIIWLLKR